MNTEPPCIAARPLAPFGFEVDLDLSQPTEQVQEQLSALLYQQGLLVFRRQNLNVERQIEVMEGFGPVLRAPEGINIVSTDPQKGWGGASELKFHSDLAFSPYPCKVMSLYAVEVEDDETSTLFASGLAAYARIPESLKTRLAPLKSRMQFPRLYAEAGSETPAWLPQTDHPAVMPHPVTGVPLLFINEMQTACLIGVSPEESRELMQAVFAWLYDPALVHEHRWRAGDLVVWDNYALQHARSQLPVRARRTLQRVIVAEKRFSELYPDVPQTEIAG